ncbi:hypothetical protein [Nocardia sp. NPDC051570]|uniref:hypothetical protein n=1 Tax=Nocardia sp. NPDC051570 TaxID=3364324 RepID=UPI0037AB69CC
MTEQDNNRELFHTNVSCPAQTVRRLIHRASRAAANIDAIGQVWIECLAEAGILEHPSDFYTLTSSSGCRRHRPTKDRASGSPANS